MPDFSEINPHLALAQSESYESDGDRAWARFCRDVKKLIGGHLDGDDDRDGYSVDGAYASFEAGETAEQYAEDVAENRAAIAKAGASA